MPHVLRYNNVINLAAALHRFSSAGPCSTGDRQHAYRWRIQAGLCVYRTHLGCHPLRSILRALLSEFLGRNNSIKKNEVFFRKSCFRGIVTKREILLGKDRRLSWRKYPEWLGSKTENKLRGNWFIKYEEFLRECGAVRQKLLRLNIGMPDSNLS